MKFIPFLNELTRQIYDNEECDGKFDKSIAEENV